MGGQKTILTNWESVKMWTAEEERQLSELWRRAEAKRHEEAEVSKRRLVSRDPPKFVLEMPPDCTTPSYPDTGNASESGMAMLRRANVGTGEECSREQPLTEADMGMSRREFDALRPERQLAIVNAAFFRRTHQND